MVARPTLDVRVLAGLLSHPSTAPLVGLDDRLIDVADQHGITPLLAESLRTADRLAALPAALHTRLVAARRGAVVLDSLRRAHEQATFAALSTAGVDTIVFKGAALAVSHYAASWQRPRGDVDVLVTADQVPVTRAVLERLGCRRVPRPAGEVVTYQARYATVSTGVAVAYDVHWRIADPQAFADVLDLPALRQRAVPGPVTGSRMAAPVDALLIACIHRAAHHFDSQRLLLICDIDRLARRFDDDEWRQVVARATAGGIRAVSARGLGLAAAWLDSPYPDWVRARLDAAGEPEPTARYVSGPMRRIDVLGSDLRRLPTWRRRAALVREHLCPPRDFMAARYGADHPLLQPGVVALLYIDRIVRGITGWFRPVH